MAKNKITISTQKGGTILRVPPSQVQVLADENVRRYHNPDIKKLVDQLLMAGRQLQPCGAEPTEDGGLKLKWGFRRHAAISYIVENGLVDDSSPLNSLEVIVVPVNGNAKDNYRASTIDGVVENTSQADRSPIDMGEYARRLCDEAGLTVREAAPIMGCSAASVSEYRKLLQLPLDVQKKIHNKQVSMAAALDVLRLPEGEERDEALRLLNEAEKPSREEVRQAAEKGAEKAGKESKAAKKQLSIKVFRSELEAAAEEFIEADENDNEVLHPPAQVIRAILDFQEGRFKRRKLVNLLSELFA